MTQRAMLWRIGGAAVACVVVGGLWLSLITRGPDGGLFLGIAICILLALLGALAAMFVFVAMQRDEQREFADALRTRRIVAERVTERTVVTERLYGRPGALNRPAQKGAAIMVRGEGG